MKLFPADWIEFKTPILKYIAWQALQQIRAVFPIAVYLLLFEWLVLGKRPYDVLIICGGLVLVASGLMFFLEGVKCGLMPLSELMGARLPQKTSLIVTLVIIFFLGAVCPFAEPAISVVETIGNQIPVREAPYIYALLKGWNLVLVITIGIGVGWSAVYGILRSLKVWGIKPTIFICVIPTLCVTFIYSFFPNLRITLGLAWDCGAIVTGPVTVPLILALGAGVGSTVSTGGENRLGGFGIVALASVYPILAIQILTLIISFIESPQSIIANAEATALERAEMGHTPSWWEVTPWKQLYLSFRAILPLVFFVLVIVKVLLRDPIPHLPVKKLLIAERIIPADEVSEPKLSTDEPQEAPAEAEETGLLSSKIPTDETSVVILGLCFTLIGMILFNYGLTFGLEKLGNQVGGLIPTAFETIDGVAPRFGRATGIAITVVFSFFLGVVAIFAEPGLAVIGAQVEQLTNGEFSRWVVTGAVSVGAGIGIAIGVLMIIFNQPLPYFIIPGYAVALTLTMFGSDDLVCVSWDSAGVATGPVVVPLVLALGVALGNSLHVIGFGIVALASVCPIVSTLITGLVLAAFRKAAAR